MLHHWLQAIDRSFYDNSDSFSIGNHLIPLSKDGNNLSSVRVAIFSDTNPSNDFWRKELYKLSHGFDHDSIADLGILRNNTPEVVIPVIKELVSAGILPIFISNDPQLTDAVFLAYRSFGKKINVLLADECIRYTGANGEPQIIDKMLQPDIRDWVRPGLIGHQQHFIHKHLKSLLTDHCYDNYRLGQLISNLGEAEPIIRHADLMIWNMSVLDGSKYSGTLNPSPNGIDGLTACTLCKYAGMSDKMSSMVFTGFAPENDQHNITAQLLAQMIWYFLDGFTHRCNDYPKSFDGLQPFMIDSKKIGFDLMFWKSRHSGRWWVQLSSQIITTEDKPDLYPCSQDEYQASAKGEVPDRILNYLSTN